MTHALPALRSCLALLMLSAVAPLSSCATQPGPGGALKTLVLRDVSGLRGGQVLFLRGDGSGVCQRLVRGGPPEHAMQERRHALALGAPAVGEMNRLLAQRHFGALAIEVRPALPGAVLRSITVRFADDRVHRVSLWAGDRNDDFSAVYQACLKILQDCAGAPVAYQGPYDPAWLPPGF